ncbi:hypothetical protein BO82DRAFT_396557 [Aspergillus uvarum CBS 121591]|uniref:Integral membrane protein n=1 Tax=Aspergillus uvarum CBS 121591 TaxID=1448315 RepID=A0A319BQU1_9EURO|nr:hypothetical protein BO82DRAFT_396557 [Aspergillus uvarum CBS 121591]PYH75856.1 hypothetical protein BO82DRAFT_396557 [Aspergillus uvarum CBS 121591]
MSRLVNWLPTVAAFIAFILTLICLFAGSQTSVLPDTSILTIYTSNISQGTEIANFYSIHVMSYCEGELRVNHKDFNNCSDRTLFFSFDPDAAIRADTGNTTSPADLGWPSAITDDFYAFQMTSRSMGIFYCLGAGVAALALLERAWWALRRGPRQTITEVSSMMLSFVMLGISSIIATVVAFQFVKLVSYHGQDAGVTAEYGPQFLSLTWAATGLYLIGGTTGLVMVLIDRSRPPVDNVPYDNDGFDEGPDDLLEDHAKSEVHSHHSDDSVTLRSHE